MIYDIKFTAKANADIAEFKKSDPASYTKVVRFIVEIQEHPRTGTGHPEPSKGGNGNLYSRRINKKDRL